MMEKFIVDLDQVLNDFEKSEQSRQSTLESAPTKSSIEINYGDDHRQTTDTQKPISQNHLQLLQQQSPTPAATPSLQLLSQTPPAPSDLKVLQQQPQPITFCSSLTPVSSTLIFSNEQKSNVDLLTNDCQSSLQTSQLLLPDFSTFVPETHRENVENQNLLGVLDDISFLSRKNEVLTNQTSIIDLLSENCDNQVCDESLILSQTPVKTSADVKSIDQDNQFVNNFDQSQSVPKISDFEVPSKEISRQQIEPKREEEEKEKDDDDKTIKSINLCDSITNKQSEENRFEDSIEFPARNDSPRQISENNNLEVNAWLLSSKSHEQTLNHSKQSENEETEGGEESANKWTTRSVEMKVVDSSDDIVSVDLGESSLSTTHRFKTVQVVTESKSLKESNDFNSSFKKSIESQTLQTNETDFTLSVETATEHVDSEQDAANTTTDTSLYSEMTEEMDPTDCSTPSPTTFTFNMNNSLGCVKPYWMPDQDAPTCLLCMVRFTVLKRRHHCRACGKVYCANCCNQKAKLPYLCYKDARVCNTCFDLLDHGESIVVSVFS